MEGDLTTANTAGFGCVAEYDFAKRRRLHALKSPKVRACTAGLYLHFRINAMSYHTICAIASVASDSRSSTLYSYAEMALQYELKNLSFRSV